MTPDPEHWPASESPLAPDNSAADLTPAESLDLTDSAGSYVVAAPVVTTVAPAEPPYRAPWPAISAAALPQPLAVPNMLDALLFTLLGVMVFVAGMSICEVIGKHLPLFRNMSYSAMSADARFNIPSMAAQYVMLAVLAAWFFRAKWKRPFLRVIQWNAGAGVKHLRWLLPAGFALALLVGFSGDYLPMPKNAPIVVDMMSTPAGAWLMFLFGFTAAPMMEELAFRGFLLPAMVNSFRNLEQRQAISSGFVNWVAVPLSIAVTSLLFTILHSSQVSGAWGPLLIIGAVSVVLCIVRLRLNSIFASVVVHSAYNFTLFAAMLYSTDGFRHLEKLNN